MQIYMISMTMWGRKFSVSSRLLAAKRIIGVFGNLKHKLAEKDFTWVVKSGSKVIFTRTLLSQMEMKLLKRYVSGLKNTSAISWS
jgi:hypothetical protein